MEHVVLVVDAVPAGPVGDVGPQYVVIHPDVVVTQLFHGQEILAQAAGVGPNLLLWKDDSQLHAKLLLTDLPTFSAGTEVKPIEVCLNIRLFE